MLDCTSKRKHLRCACFVNSPGVHCFLEDMADLSLTSKTTPFSENFFPFMPTPPPPGRKRLIRWSDRQGRHIPKLHCRMRIALQSRSFLHQNRKDILNHFKNIKVYCYARESPSTFTLSLYTAFDMVSLFDLHPIAKTCGSIVMAEESTGTLTTYPNFFLI